MFSGWKRLFGFHFFSSSSSPQGMFHGPSSAGVCTCACTCVYAHTDMQLSRRHRCILSLRCQCLPFSPLLKWRHWSALEVSLSEVEGA